MFNDIKIENFRGLENFELSDFKQFNLFVGKNNTGKSTILDAIYLLVNPSNPQLHLTINSLRNINIFNPKSWELIFYGLNSNLEVKLSANLNNDENRHLQIKKLQKLKSITSSTSDASLESSGSSEGIIESAMELIYSYSKDGKDNNVVSNSFLESSVDKGLNINFSMPKNQMNLETIEGIYLTPTNLKKEVAQRLGEYRVNKGKSGLKRIINILKKIDPQIEDLIIGPDNDVYCDIGFEKSLLLNVIGDGVIKILAVVLAMSKIENGIFLIDEIENGLHRTSQKLLWETIFESAKEFNVQVFVTTHSLEAIKTCLSIYKQFSIEDDLLRLFRIEKINNETKSVRYDYDLLEASVESGWEVR